MPIDARLNAVARRVLTGVKLLLLAPLFPRLVTAAAAYAQAWKPDKPVEIIATNAPGGGADRIIRIMLNAMQERRDFAVPVSIDKVFLIDLGPAK